MDDKIKVKVGQVWIGSSGNRTISKIDKGLALAVDSNGNGERGFGRVDESGYATWNTDSYPMLKDVEEKTPAAMPPAPKETDTLLDFFKSVPPGRCACNILKAQCRYHGTSKV